MGIDEGDEDIVDQIYGGVAQMGSIPKGGETQILSHYFRSHWTTATTETLVKLEDLDEYVVALVDYSSEINLMSKELYE